MRAPGFPLPYLTRNTSTFIRKTIRMEENISHTAEDAARAVEAGAGAIGALIKAAGKDQNARAAGGELGRAALTLTKTINIGLLPLAAINFGYEKARRYFEKHFQEDLHAKAGTIPEEHIIEPKPSVAGPALQALAFSHDESSLREMYLHLIASSMDMRLASRVHPAFVEIVRQMSAEEAELAEEILRHGVSAPIVQIRLKGDGTEYAVILNHLIDHLQNDVPSENSRMPAIVDNWIRLGLV